jgi:hypothetical protein
MPKIPIYGYSRCDVCRRLRHHTTEKEGDECGDCREIVSALPEGFVGWLARVIDKAVNEAIDMHERSERGGPY